MSDSETKIDESEDESEDEFSNEQQCLNCKVIRKNFILN